MTADTQFLDTKEVAEILGVHPKTGHSWLRTGKLAGTKISYRAWRISRSALDEFIARNSNMHPKNAINSGSDGKSTEVSQKTDASSETGMKHYIRNIMGEDSNGRPPNNE